MSPDARVEAVYHAALDLPQAERDGFIRRSCAGDSALEARVRKLLRHFDLASDSFLRPPVAPPETTQMSGRLGHFELHEIVGEGGMGVVYRATQLEPVRREVAIKIVRLGLHSKEVIARFEMERQSLAQLEHATIARVYDAGSTPDGRPYFAMEFVDGRPITQYCDEERLTPRERVELFARVCRGVQHAHQSGIIHRDLKPSNILVSGDAEPKIIDFGVAKATEREWSEATAFTRFGQLIGTPEYMSPEQAKGESVDTRSDIYSLGVILYELLAGSLPIDATTLRAAGFEGMMRMIREDDPPRPSTRVSTLGASAMDAARRRRTEPRSLARALRGELDWIAMKALEKDRERRYESVAQLADDLHAHLYDEPVRARPQSAWYALGKFARKRRVVVGFAGMLVMAAIAVHMTMMIQARRIAVERDRANHEAEVAVEVKDFVVGLFSNTSPAEARGDTMTVRDLLERGVARADKLENPAIRAEMLTTLGVVCEEFGLREEAWRLLEEAEALWRRVKGTGSPRALTAGADLAGIEQNLGHYAAAESLYVEAIVGWKRLGAEYEERAYPARMNLAVVRRQRGHYAEAETTFLDLLDWRRQRFGADDREVLRIRRQLGWVYSSMGRYDEAREFYEAAVDGARRELGEDHPETLVAKDGLSDVYSRLGLLEQSERLANEVLKGNRRVYGEDHWRTIGALETYAILQYRLRDLEAAIEHERQVLEWRRSRLGEAHATTLTAMNNLAAFYSESGRTDEARELMVEALELRRRVLGDSHPQTLDSHVTLAMLEVRMGDPDAAMEQFQHAVDHGYAHPFLLQVDVLEILEPLAARAEFAALLDSVRARLGRSGGS